MYHVAWLTGKLYQAVNKAREQIGHFNVRVVAIVATIVFLFDKKT